MKLTKKQKDIVNNILAGNITDIFSYVKHYQIGKAVSFDKECIKSKFDDTYKGRSYKCEKRHFLECNEMDRVVETIDNNTAYCVPRLDWKDSYSICSHKDVNYSYNLFSQVYIMENISEIVSFIALMQYLKQQALIIELPKTCTKEDMELFLRQKASTEHTIVRLEEDSDKTYCYFDLDISYSDFFDGRYNLDKESFEICLPYLLKKIYPAPELITFIQNGYKTDEEINNRINLRIAFAGVVIAICTSIASIWISYSETDYKKELQEIRDSLQSIQEKMTNQDEKELQDIQESLQSIKEEMVNDKNSVLEDIRNSLEAIQKEISNDDSKTDKD